MPTDRYHMRGYGHHGDIFYPLPSAVQEKNLQRTAVAGKDKHMCPSYLLTLLHGTPHLQHQGQPLLGHLHMLQKLG